MSEGEEHTNLDSNALQTPLQADEINTDHLSGNVAGMLAEEGSNGEEKSMDSTGLEHSTGDDSCEDGTGYWKNMPLFKYSRITGALPRSTANVSTETPDNNNNNGNQAFSTPCRCTAMGKVVIKPSPSREISDSLEGEVGTTQQSGLQEEINQYTASKPNTFHVLAMGFDDGSIHLVDPLTGIPICSPDKLQVGNNKSSSTSIVSLSFDSTSKYLSACCLDGDTAIFELHFGLKTTIISGESRQSLSLSSQHEQQQRPHLFDTFLSKIAGDENHQETSSTQENFNGETKSNDVTNEFQTGDRILTMLSLIQPISTARFTYKTSVGGSETVKVTCAVLDPSYEQNRDKSILVGLEDGRVLLTKRSSHGGVQSGGVRTGGFSSKMGVFFQPKRNDVELYVGISSSETGSNGGDKTGIETVAWRGSLISWADSSGIKVFDVDKMVRIAHIDRPTGARSSLYPTITSLRPTLLFEKSDSLLIAWGDCLMNMTIKVKEIKSRPSGSSDYSTTTAVTRRKTVECEMAWELDCIASSVIPIDRDHVGVLGLVPVPDANVNIEETKENGQHLGNKELTNIASEGQRNLLELQIISRKEGSIKCSDIIMPVTDGNDGDLQNASNSYHLVSSFCTSRMEDTIEAEEEALLTEHEGFDVQAAIMDTLGSPLSNEQKKTFIDSHMKWDMEECIRSFDAFIPGSGGANENASDQEHGSEDGDDSSYSSDNSVDSDDYTFLFRSDVHPPASSQETFPPPLMVITSPNDAVLTQTRDIDDAISYTQSDDFFGLALKLGIDNRRIIRRQSLHQLINEYLMAVLSLTTKDYSNKHSGLTIRRLKIAAKATPILFGGDIHLWSKWTKEFAKIPGGLFILKQYLPVRDPKLPSWIYETVLDNMLAEIETMVKNSYEQTSSDVSTLVLDGAIDLYFKTLRSWGPNSSIKDRIKIHQMSIDQSKSQSVQHDMSVDAEKALSCRMNQNSLNYLQYGSALQENSNSASEISINLSSGISSESLFVIEEFMEKMKPRIKRNDQEESSKKMKEIALYVMAELDFMRGKYDSCLVMYLVHGALFPLKSLTLLEDVAIDSLNNKYKTSFTSECDHDGFDKFTHVLMIIETYHLHHILLKDDILKTFDGCSRITPIISLICLTGLENSLQFILEHCILAKSSPRTSNRRQDRGSALPIDLVANQLKASPKLLLWFLQNLIYEKPEIYTSFSNTAVPPRYITDLHRLHFDLIMKYAPREGGVERSLSEMTSYDEFNSPLLDFLKAALPHGGIRSIDVRKTLESSRAGSHMGDDNDKKSEQIDDSCKHLFAGELAYIIERSGTGTAEDAKTCIYLYLHSVSLQMAVLYAMRNTPHSSMLWETMVAHCLDEKNSLKGANGANGLLFGALLEVAARSGADLANLISKIPDGLNIVGIRPKLVSAISDYRLKLKIHESTSGILHKDKICLLRSQIHRSRRGIRVLSPKTVFRNKQEGSSEETPQLDSSASIERLCIKRRQRQLDMIGSKAGVIAQQSMMSG